MSTINTGFSVAAMFNGIFPGGKVGEVGSCLGVDIQIARPAPIGKCFGIDESAYHDIAMACAIFLESLSFCEPYVESVGKLMTVGHDSEDSVVIFRAVPRHSNE